MNNWTRGQINYVHKQKIISQDGIKTKWMIKIRKVTKTVDHILQ